MHSSHSLFALRGQKQANLERLWDQHMSKKYDRGTYLWAVLAFIAWYDAH